MHGVFYDVPELLNWLDEFAKSSGLVPSQVARIYAELVECRDVNHVFAQVADRSKCFKALIAEGDQAGYLTYLDDVHSSLDENLPLDDLDERHAHYRRVLSHHGFSKKFISMFYDNLLPSNGQPPEGFSMDRSEIFERYNPEPFYGASDESHIVFGDTGVSPNFSLINPKESNSMNLDEMRLSRPIHPIGWVKLMQNLGFTVSEINNGVDLPLEVPKFLVTDTSGSSVSVFINGLTRSPGDHEDEQANLLKRILAKKLPVHKSASKSTLILFYGMPVMVGRNGGASGITYWGEVYFNNKWSEMILNSKTRTINDIIDQSHHADEIGGLDPLVFGDTDGALVGLFLSENKDPLMEMMEQMGKNFKF
jgi:hypothetical protein